MQPLNYIIFHPDSAREEFTIRGRAIKNGHIEEWDGSIWIDKDDGGNEDPFVLSETWIYSFCHATQLRRKPYQESPHVRRGSYLFFCSGDAADRGWLQFDTVFVVNNVAEWPEPSELPKLFSQHQNNSDSDLWTRHFVFSPKSHEGKYTYVAKPWANGARDYSFLPIDHSGNRTSIALAEFSADFQELIRSKLYLKRPAMVSEDQKNQVLAALLTQPVTQVVTIHTRRPSTSSIMTQDMSSTHIDCQC